ncbi:hypothetical protein N9891_02105, partial [bacterium]|nr:hypothetical protein [bacterium]
MNVRGDRYLVHEREHFEDLLGGQGQLLSEALGVSSKQIVEGFSAIIDSLTYGIGDAMSEMRELMAKVDPIFLTRASKVNPKTDEEARKLMSEVIEAEGLGEKMAWIQSRAFGMALFDLGQVTDLPSSFLKALSWGLGEESSFFSGDEFAGWPTRATPISKRPFITIDGKHYCFCIYALCDHFYRTVEKMVRKAKPDSVDSWNQNQTEITEELPLKYLRKILPKSDSFKSVYYRWYPKEGHPKREWCEVDGLFLVEDHLIVIEVKAPAFSSQSPFDRFDTHADSVRKLVGDPIRQGARFVEYLKHHDEVQIYDADHKPVGCLNQAAFRKITICAMSIDPMTEIASKAHRLKPLGIDTGDLPVWAISLDDLRVCSEVFTHPLVFLHFLEKRTKASQEMNVELNDELDHIGLYFEHNDYTL